MSSLAGVVVEKRIAQPLFPLTLLISVGIPPSPAWKGVGLEGLEGSKSLVNLVIVVVLEMVQSMRPRRNGSCA